MMLNDLYLLSSGSDVLHSSSHCGNMCLDLRIVEESIAWRYLNPVGDREWNWGGSTEGEEGTNWLAREEKKVHRWRGSSQAFKAVFKATLERMVGQKFSSGAACRVHAHLSVLVRHYLQKQVKRVAAARLGCCCHPPSKLITRRHPASPKGGQAKLASINRQRYHHRA